ncbi:MAG: YegS/Rv2252/BmrU family lipid kinase [Alistipes sp.]|nr:YegS/Rv2252/BmrU family lipid kinase [Alistipes sp.]
MKTLLLYNPKAGKRRVVRNLDNIVATFQKANFVVKPQILEFDKNPFDGNEDMELVVVCGGDGTINFVINKMREKGLDITLGIIPTGTANDFAGAIGAKHNILRAARQIARGTERRVDCGKVNDRYFVNVLSFGVLTTTSQQTSDAEKHIFGKLAYLRVGTRDLMTMHRIPIVAKFDNEEVHTDAAMMLIFNGRSAGRFKLAPDASINDGMLDILILDYENMAKICASMMHYLIGGKDSKVRYIRTNHIELHCDIDERTDVDGQPGPQFPLSVQCLKDELKIRI